MRVAISMLLIFGAILGSLPRDAAAQARDSLRLALTPARADAIDASMADTAIAPKLAPRKGDPVWEGIAIGAAAGIVGGLVIAPRMLCGSNDSECSVIVRAAVGLPLIAGAMVAGGLIDKFHVQGPVVWKNTSGRGEARVGGFPNGGAGVQMTLRLR